MRLIENGIIEQSRAKQTTEQFVSIKIQEWLYGQGDLWTHYSVEILFINVAIDAFCRTFSMEEGQRSGLRPRAYVACEIK